MSLDVYLNSPESSNVSVGSGIFVRQNGETTEISRAEWDEKFPNREPIITEQLSDDDTQVYHANITHNLNKMAGAAGLYEVLWRPDELGFTQAAQLVERLTTGLALLESDRTRFDAFNPDNGWGNYDGLVQFVRNYLRACEQYPDAVVHVSR